MIIKYYYVIFFYFFKNLFVLLLHLQNAVEIYFTAYLIRCIDYLIEKLSEKKEKEPDFRFFKG